MIEILTFRLAPDADESEFLSVDKRVQAEFAYQQPGLLRRTTARNSSGEWIVIDLWQSEAHADACDANWARDDLTRQYMTFVDGTTVRSSRYYELD